MNLPKEYTLSEATEYAKLRGKNTKFYRNVFGWDLYLTLEPTFATPTGKDKNFKRSIIVKANTEQTKK